MVSLLKLISKEPPVVDTKKPKRTRKGKQPVATLPPPPPSGKKKKKKPIPVALREQVWLKHMGRVFEGKCSTTWCKNNITVFDFQSGHNIPESKGGATNLENLIPLCSRCNLSMGNEYTIDQWCKVFEESTKAVPIVEPKRKWFWCFLKN